MTYKLTITILLLITLGACQAEPTKDNTIAQEEKEMGQFLGAKETIYPDWFKQSFLDFNEDVLEAAENGKRVLIIFHQDNCPYCNALIEHNFAQKDIEEMVRNNLEPIAINMWGDREVATVEGQSLTEKEFASVFRVQFTPTQFFLDEQGRIALRLNGYLPPATFKQALNYVIKKKEKELTYSDYLATLQPLESQGELIHRDFFKPPPHDLSNKESNKPIAVFFEQKHCPNCQTLHQKALKNKETLKLLQRFRVIQLDMWGKTPLTTPSGINTTARLWAKELNINYAPAIVLFDADGKEIIRSEALFKTFHTQSIFDYVLSNAYTKEPSFQRYLTERADHIREQGIDVNIWD